MALISNILIFLAVSALGLAAAIVLPGLTGWPVWLVSVVAVAAALLALAVLEAWSFHQLARRLARLESGLARTTARLDVLRQDLKSLEDRSGVADSRSAEMIQEMRVLQTLLGQIVTRRGTPGGPSARPGEGVRDRAPGAVEPADLDEIIRNAVAENRIDLYLQPTVALPARRAAHYECFSRVRDPEGHILYPNEYLPLAESSGLIGTLDNLLLFRCIQLIRKLGHRRPRVRFFCNISERSVSDKEFFPQFMDYMRGNRELARRLVFEFSQREFREIPRETLRQLGALAEEGYRFAIDQIDDPDLDPAALAAEHVSFVKIDADLLLREGGPSPRALREALAEHDVTLIATKVEAEGQVLDLLDHDIRLAQGYLFGEPRLSREDPSAPADARTAS
ncbi:MAG: EAL domain-containing protein [Rhodothalassiaceae bacterium]